MIPSNPHPHQAQLDADGNIVLPADAAISPPVPPAIKPERNADWELTEEAPALRPHLAGIRKWTREALNEEWSELEATVHELPPLIHEFEAETETLFQSLRRLLFAPVWTGEAKPSKHSRGTLFLVDIVRFGGTFAGIFLILFVALNFASFYAITMAKLSPFLDPPSVGSSDPASTALLAAVSPTKLAASHRSVLDFLPPVGPPENRLIVPKLRLNVPIVNPDTAALLRQDWPQVERDIQKALEGGVVHYPGTAVAGQAGNFFMTGHSSYYQWAPGKYKSVFARLSDLEPGDEYWVYFGGDKHRYVVRSKKEVKPNDISVLDQPSGKRLSTLMTCTPVGTTLRRLVVQAEEVDTRTGLALKVGERTDTVARPSVRLEALPI